MLAAGGYAPVAVRSIPMPALRGLSLVVPFIREMAELSYMWTRPYVLDSWRTETELGSGTDALGRGLPPHRRGQPGARQGLTGPVAPSQRCSFGHHQVVRPPTVATAISAPQRGQCRPVLRNSIISPVCTPPCSIADVVADCRLR